MSEKVDDLIAKVAAAGGRLWLEDGQVRYAASRQALPAGLLDDLRRHKAAIAGVLEAKAKLSQDFGVRAERLPLSAEELFFFDPANTSRTGFPIMRTCMALSGPWSAEILRHALLRLVAENEILRTAYIRDGAGDRRVIAPADCFTPAEIDARGLAAEALDAVLARQAVADNAVVDVSKAPLFRAALFFRGEGELLLLLTGHHITYDGSSWAMLINRLFKLYAEIEGGGPAEEKAAYQYADYAAQQRSRLQDPAGATILAYWRDKCANLPEPLLLGMGEDGNTPLPRQTVALDIAPDDVAALADVARARGASLFHAVLALFHFTLARRSGARDIVIGSPFMTRDFHPQKGMLGCLVDQLVFRQEVNPEMSFLDLLDNVRRESLSAYGRTPLCSDLVAESIGFSFDEFHRRAYSVMLVNQSSLPGLDAASLALAERDLRITAYDSAGLAAAIDALMPAPGPGQPVLSMIWTQLAPDRPAKGLLTYFRGRSPAAQTGLVEIQTLFLALARTVGRQPDQRLADILP